MWNRDSLIFEISFQRRKLLWNQLCEESFIWSWFQRWVNRSTGVALGTFFGIGTLELALAALVSNTCCVEALLVIHEANEVLKQRMSINEQWTQAPSRNQQVRTLTDWNIHTNTHEYTRQKYTRIHTNTYEYTRSRVKQIHTEINHKNTHDRNLSKKRRQKNTHVYNSPNSACWGVLTSFLIELGLSDTLFSRRQEGQI